VFQQLPTHPQLVKLTPCTRKIMDAVDSARCPIWMLVSSSVTQTPPPNQANVLLQRVVAGMQFTILVEGGAIWPAMSASSDMGERQTLWTRNHLLTEVIVISETGRNARLDVMEELRPAQEPAVTQLQLTVELIVTVMPRNPGNATLTLASTNTK